MELLNWLFDKNTRHGRGLRTALQGMLAIVTFLGGLIALPGMADLLLQNNLTTIGAFGTWVGIIAYLQNALEDLWNAVK